MKKVNKSKGFTLIELMVVIAIISLLSSIVLAYIKTSREKAMIQKTVSEMKSLQTALELYRNQFGVYPILSSYPYFVDDAPQLAYGGLDDFVQNSLIANKFLTKIPHSPLYPNNCGEYDCQNSGYFLGYSTYNYSFSEQQNLGYFYFLCDGQKINNYFIYFFANYKKINLPTLKYYNNGDIYDFMTGDSEPLHTYCIAM